MMEHELTETQAAVVDSIARLSHHYAWMTYAEIRRGIPASIAKHTSQGLHQIIDALNELESAGILKRKQSGITLYGFTAQYDRQRRLATTKPA